MRTQSRKYSVLVTDYAWPSLDIERSILSQIGAEVLIAMTGDEAELLELAPEVDAILTCFQPVSSAVLEAAGLCRTVARYGVGLDNIDVATATSLGIVVSNVPDYCIDEVSDHAAALILALARNVVPFARATASGQWDSSRATELHRLRGRTLGLVGFGRVAQLLASKMQAFGLTVLAYTPRASEHKPQAMVKLTSDLDELLSEADIVSLHVPLNDATRGLIDSRALRLMKPTAVLINTSRGAVVDSAALTLALMEGRLAGAALDVLPHEPPAADDPLLGLDSVIVTPHAAFASAESISELQQKAATNVAASLSGEIPPYIVNPEVTKTDLYLHRNQISRPGGRDA